MLGGATARGTVQRWRASCADHFSKPADDQPDAWYELIKRLCLAGLIGTLLVMLFMIFYYRLLGVFAAIALIIYIALTLGVFKLIPSP